MAVNKFIGPESHLSPFSIYFWLFIAFLVGITWLRGDTFQMTFEIYVYTPPLLD